MWCGRKSFLGKANFTEVMRKRKESKQSEASSEMKKDFAEDFKITLAAMTSVEDYQTQADQFMGSK